LNRFTFCKLLESKTLWFAAFTLLAAVYFWGAQNIIFASILLLLLLLNLALCICRYRGILKSNFGNVFQVFGVVVSLVGIFAIISFLLET
jgi:type III secretory pathway component EscV